MQFYTCFQFSYSNVRHCTHVSGEDVVSFFAETAFKIKRLRVVLLESPTLEGNVTDDNQDT